MVYQGNALGDIDLSILLKINSNEGSLFKYNDMKDVAEPSPETSCKKGKGPPFIGH